MRRKATGKPLHVAALQLNVGLVRQVFQLGKQNSRFRILILRDYARLHIASRKNHGPWESAPAPTPARLVTTQGSKNALAVTRW